MSAGAARSDAGISLVEIMVALFIVGLASSFVILNIPQTPTPLEATRRSVEEMLNTAAKLADVGGEPYGFRLEDGRVEPLIFRRGVWEQPTGFNGLKPLDIPESVELRLPDAQTSQRFSTIEEEEPVEPSVWFDPVGIARSGSFELVWKGSAYLFSIDERGGVDVQKTGGL